MNAARKRKLLRKRARYALSPVPAELVEAIAASVREKLYRDLNKPSLFARIPFRGPDIDIPSAEPDPALFDDRIRALRYALKSMRPT